ncbi:MAG TPA: ABC transporter permease, partial [Rhodocyclaceae bacterium]|nr:ABC transporter permease [Rhodocyclaceae bacterium]
MMPVVLWSDALLFLLLLAAVGLGWWSRRQEHLRLAWSRVARDPAAMAAATLLAAFVAVGVLDSLHYRAALPAEAGKPAVYAVEVNSALDALLMPLKVDTEKTYSAPMAVRLFAKESIEGEVGRDFPRLRYGGAELGDDLARYPADVFGRAASGFGLGLALWGIAWLLCLPLRRRRTGVAWNAVLAALFALCLLGGPVAGLAGHYHVLGTDKVGQDVLYLSLKAIRTGLLIGTLTTLIMLPAAVLLGILAGYVGGWVDDIIQYLYTTLNSIPGVLLIAAAVLMMQVVIDNHPSWFPTGAERADARLLALCAILGVTSWTGLCRLLRGEALKLREADYVQAARAFGVSRLAVMLRHILPNVMHIVMISVVMDFSGLVLAEAVLSYVGVGVDPNTISFGTMINAARMELAREPMVWWSLAA